TTDNGLAASMYAASKVTAKVGTAGTEVSVVQETDYPFGDAITFTVQGSARFPFYLRIPGWASEFTVTVNSTRTPVKAQAGWIKLDRAWRSGDRVKLVLPMRTTTRVWSDNQAAVSVDRGPLTYSLAIDERTEVIGGTDDWPELAVYPESPWNYGLVARTHFDLVRRTVPRDANPFTHAGTPLLLKAKARRIPQWEADSEDVVGLLQPSPARSTQPVEQVTLVPMGAARLRITSFPSVAAGGTTWRYRPRVTASHVNDGDSLEAPDDGRTPSSSADTSIPRFTWWDRRGTTEWIQYDLRQPRAVSTASAYWFDDTGFGACRVPASWRVLWLDGSTWRPVEGASTYGVERDRLNQVGFTAVRTQLLRVEAVLRPTFSGGLLELDFG
ncbi:MAG: hypothetical protein QOH03_2075, partial [Kribbellaceae bacterium]|nr:hypothetical protein [Kribbellaceae bacterium]